MCASHRHRVRAMRWAVVRHICVEVATGRCKANNDHIEQAQPLPAGRGAPSTALRHPLALVGDLGELAPFRHRPRNTHSARMDHTTPKLGTATTFIREW